MTSCGLLFRALIWGPLLKRPVQALGMVASIALGVAMVAAIHWINASALHSFQQGVNALSGRGDATLEAVQGPLAEELLPEVRQLAEVEAAFPALEMELVLDDGGDLKLLGVDLFHDAALRGNYLPERGALELTRLFQHGALLLGQEAAERLDKRVGDQLVTQIGVQPVRLRIVGLLPTDSFWANGAVMDIATAQWTFQRLGELDRIDLVLTPGATVAQLRNRVDALGKQPIRMTRPELEGRRLAAMTRAYRTNLNLLALAGLLTATFLVYSLLNLSMRHRRPQFHLLRILGMSRYRLAAWLLGGGAVLGGLGSLLGLGLGLGLAWLGIEYLGGDLGAGYFRDLETHLHTEVDEQLGLGLLGIGFTLLGTLTPIMDSIRGAGESGMRRGGAESRSRLGIGPRLAIAGTALVAALGLAGLPAWQGLPIAGYTAIALVLGVGLILSSPLLRLFTASLPIGPRHFRLWLARAQLHGAPRRGAAALSAVLVSFALLVAIATMVHSFRGSFTQWLDQILAADLYLRSGSAGASTYLPPNRIEGLRQWPSVAALEGYRIQTLHWSPKGQEEIETPVRLTARALDQRSTRQSIELIEGRWPPKGSLQEAVLVSEAFSRRFAIEVGETLNLPFGSQGQPVKVVGIWRDYASEWGNLLVDREAYRSWTGDSQIDQLAIFAAPEADTEQLRRRLETSFQEVPAVTVAEATEIRRFSLEIFDQSFAATYVLVVIAVGVGLAGILQALAVQALERRGEIAMLRYLGFRIWDVALIHAWEAGLAGAFGAMVGLVTGVGIAALLVEVVNEQSFHWSLPIAFPLGLVVCAWLGVVAVSFAGGFVLGWRQGQPDPTQAVGEE